MDIPCGTGVVDPPAVGDAPPAVAALPEVVEDWGVSTAVSWRRGPRAICRSPDSSVFAPANSTVTAYSFHQIQEGHGLTRTDTDEGRTTRRARLGSGARHLWWFRSGAGKTHCQALPRWLRMWRPRHPLERHGSGEQDRHPGGRARCTIGRQRRSEYSFTGQEPMRQRTFPEPRGEFPERRG